MSKFFDGSSLAGISYFVLDNATHPMISDGTGLLYANPGLVSRYDEIGGRIEYAVPVTGDFEVSANLTIPDYTDWVMNQNGGMYLDFYVNFNANVYSTDGTDYSNDIDFYLYEDKTQPNGIVFKEYNFNLPITLTYPWTGDLKVTKVGTTVTILVGESVLWTGTHINNATVGVTDVDLQFNYDLNAEAPAYPATAPLMKVNDVSFVGNTTSSNANLNLIKPNGYTLGALSPSFSMNTTTYTLAAAYLTSEITFDLLADDSTATMTLNGIPIESNITSQVFPLAYGANVFTIGVTANDGVTTKTYTVTVTRNSTPSTVATLKEIIYGSTLTPSFSATVYAYTTTLPYTTSSQSFKINCTNVFAKIKVNGVNHVPATYYYFNNLVEGDNLNTIEVTAEDGVTILTYTLNIIRTPLSHDATLSSLIVSGTYGATIGPETSDPCRKFTMVQNSTYDFTATGCRAYNDVVVLYCGKSNAFSTVTINGANYVASGFLYQRTPTHLVSGENTLTVVCTAQDGVTSNTYTVHVNKPEKYAYAQGTGTLEDPYQVWTPEDLNGMRDWSGCRNYTQYWGLPFLYFKQMADIDLAGYPNWNPLGTNPDESSVYKSGFFCNGFDGNGFEITNLTINGNTTSQYIGLFASFGAQYFVAGTYTMADKSSARLRNVTITNANVVMNKSNTDAGILCGVVYSPILNCHVQGRVEYPTDVPDSDTATRYVGGLCGRIGQLQCFAYRCSSTATLVVHDDIGNITPSVGVGGFAGGFVGSGSGSGGPGDFGIFESFAVATIDYVPRNLFWVQNSTYIGGFIGFCAPVALVQSNLAVIKNCYAFATLNVSAELNTGVFTGLCYVPILNSYAVGNITESTDGVGTSVGGFSGGTSTTYKDAAASMASKTLDLNSCYYDDTVYTVNDVAPLGNTNTPHNGIPKTTTELKTQGTFVDWDFNSIWLFDPAYNNGYPLLMWMVPPPVYYNIIHYIKQHGYWVEVKDGKTVTTADISDFNTAANALIQSAVTAALGTGQ